MKNTLALSLAILTTGLSQAKAATLAYYVDGADYNDNAIPVVTVETGVTADNIAVVGLNGGASGNIRNSYGAVIPGNGFWLMSSGGYGPSSDNATNPPADDYHGYTLTADAGMSMNMSQLSFNWGFGHNNLPLNGTYGFRVFASIDGGSWVDLGHTSVTTSAAQGVWVDQGVASIDLSSLSATADGGTVEIRVRPYTEANPGSVIAFQNITLSGEVSAVPEPSSLAMLGLGGLVLLRRKR